jgi:hypothetical protein
MALSDTRISLGSDVAEKDESQGVIVQWGGLKKLEVIDIQYVAPSIAAE